MHKYHFGDSGERRHLSLHRGNAGPQEGQHERPQRKIKRSLQGTLELLHAQRVALKQQMGVGFENFAFFVSRSELTTSAKTRVLTRSPVSAEMSAPNCTMVVRNLRILASCRASSS